MPAEGQKKRGRPLQGHAPKCVPLPCRTDPMLGRLVQDAATRNGRSLSCEIEARLYFSFDAENDTYWKDVAAEAMKLEKGGHNGDR